MTVRLTIAVLAFSVGLASCSSLSTGGWCASDTGIHHWRHLAAPPPNAAALRRLADTHTSFHFEPKRELWFSAEDGSITLCRLSENVSPQYSSSGEIWQFSASGELADEGEGNGWVTVD